MNIKSLVKKFSYTELTILAKRKGWTIPSSKDLKSKDISHTAVWVSDIPTCDNEDGTRAVLFNPETNESHQVSKYFKKHCVVITDKANLQ